MASDGIIFSELDDLPDTPITRSHDYPSSENWESNNYKPLLHFEFFNKYPDSINYFAPSNFSVIIMNSNPFR